MEIEKRNIDKYFAINRKMKFLQPLHLQILKMVFSTNGMFSIIFLILDTLNL